MAKKASKKVFKLDSVLATETCGDHPWVELEFRSEDPVRELFVVGLSLRYGSFIFYSHTLGHAVEIGNGPKFVPTVYGEYLLALHAQLSEIVAGHSCVDRFRNAFALILDAFKWSPKMWEEKQKAAIAKARQYVGDVSEAAMREELRIADSIKASNTVTLISA